MGDEIRVESRVGYKTGEPLVQIVLRGERCQLGVKEAREHAVAILTCAEAAESDLFIWRLMTERVGLATEQAAQVIGDFRKFRAERGTL
jgi:hypothetical protein